MFTLSTSQLGIFYSREQDMSFFRTGSEMFTSSSSLDCSRPCLRRSDETCTVYVRQDIQPRRLSRQTQIHWQHYATHVSTGSIISVTGILALLQWVKTISRMEALLTAF